MPLTIKFNKKEVKRNHDTEKLIKLLSNVLSQNHICENILNEVARHDQKGFWGVLLKLVETATGGLHNYEIITFSPMELDLDASAFVLFKLYQNYLNSVTKKMECSAKETQDISISNHYVLLREILLRLVAITLKVKIDDANYGKKIIKVLNEFVGVINESEILVKKNWFSDELTIFGIDLVTSHDDWISIFEKMVDLIRDIHLPQTSISEMLTYLLEVKNTIARHILIRANYKIEAGELSDDWIMDTFMRFEKHWSPTMKAIALQNHEFVFPNTSFDAIRQNSIQNEICKLIQSHTGQNIDNLFCLLNKSNLLFKIGMQIENLITIGGWMPIISGLINLDNLWKLFGSHIQNCDALLTFTKDELERNKANVLYQEWVKYRKPQVLLRGLSLQHNLTLLKSPAIRQKIFTLISDSVSQLQLADANVSQVMGCNEDYSLVNKNILINFTGLPSVFHAQQHTVDNQQYKVFMVEKNSQSNKSLSIAKVYQLYEEYKSDTLRYIGNFFTPTSSEETISFVKQATSQDINNYQRAIIVLDYIQDKKNEALGFCVFLKEKMNQNLVFEVDSQQVSTGLGDNKSDPQEDILNAQDLLQELGDLANDPSFTPEEKAFFKSYTANPSHQF